MFSCYRLLFRFCLLRRFGDYDFFLLFYLQVLFKILFSFCLYTLLFSFLPFGTLWGLWLFSFLCTSFILNLTWFLSLYFIFPFLPFEILWGRWLFCSFFIYKSYSESYSISAAVLYFLLFSSSCRQSQKPARRLEEQRASAAAIYFPSLKSGLWKVLILWLCVLYNWAKSILFISHFYRSPPLAAPNPLYLPIVRLVSSVPSHTKKEEITSLAFRCDLRKGMKGFLLSCLFD